MKVIDLKDRTLFIDDIIQLYIEEKYSPERYNIQTTNGIYLVYKEDYFKVKDYLLSLNDEVKEDLKFYELEQQLQQKENIIKEAREYIVTYEEKDNITGFELGWLKRDLLDILDKENKE